MSTITNVVSESSTGVCTATAAATSGVTWNLTSLQISQSGPTTGPNARVKIWDGPVGSGTLIFSAFLSGPGAGFGGSLPAGGSVGMIQDVPLPKGPTGVPSIQNSPGNAMNVQVTGTGANSVIINARFSDGLPPA